MEKQNKQVVEIVKLLKAGAKKESYTSGQKISDSLDISRTAVWKHIKRLRGSGYKINSSPKKGYKLVIDESIYSDIEILSELKTSFVGHRIDFFDEVKSTNSTAFKLATDGAKEGATVIAKSQTGGKGRLGRRWESPKGEEGRAKNLYTSIILRPKVSPTEAQSLTLLTAVAVAETIAKFTSKPPTVKWPNDLLIDGKKVAGILTEMKTDTDSVDFIVIGIGININMTQSDMSDEIKSIATSILNHSGNLKSKTSVPLSAVGTTLFENIEKWYNTFSTSGVAPILKKWESYFDSVGRTVNVVSSNSFSGICLGIDDRGALLVRDSDGTIKTVISGDIEHAKINH